MITMTSSYTPTTLPEGERPPAPTPLSPGHRARLTDTTPIFFWSPVNGAVNYRIMIFDHKLASERRVDIRQNTTNKFLMLSTPLEPDRYFWRVRARAQGTWSRWSVRFTLWIDEVGPTPTTTPPIVPTVTPSLTSGQPDLHVQGARIELQNGNVCDTWGTGVDIHNQGDAAAGPFHVLVDGVELSVPGLGAGQTTYVWKGGTANPTTITVDNQGEVMESNEANNTFSMILPIPTLPVHCTWTDTPTGSPGAEIDLYVQSARIELENGNNCDLGLGTAVTVHNQGNVSAGPFNVLADGVQLSVAGLSAGQSVYLWKAGYSNPTTVTVDVNSAVAESDETNNTFSEMLPIPTPPIECTWTDTPTPTPGGPTDTPTPVTLLDPPILIWPSHLLVLNSNIVTFQVIPPLLAESVEYEISDGLSNVLLTQTEAVANNLTVELPMGDVMSREFWWRARGVVETNTGPWSESSPFTVTLTEPTETPTPGGVTNTPTPTTTPTGTTTPLPDLLVHYVTNGLRPPCLGAPMAVEFGVTNWGDENVPSFVYSVNGTQVPLITPIPPQATLRVIHEDAARDVVNSGHITVVLDPLNAIPEWNEANNIGTAFPLTLTPPAPCP